MNAQTQELTGAALDWAAAKLEGFEPFTDGISWIIDNAGTYQQLPSYSSDWAQGGPIIERERIWLDPEIGKEGTAGAWYAVDMHDSSAYGPTPLIAVMRCYVASKMGDEIEVPDELL